MYVLRSYISYPLLPYLINNKRDPGSIDREHQTVLKVQASVPWQTGGVVFSDIPTSHPWVVFLGLSHLQRIESDLGLHVGSLLLFSLGCGGLLGATVQHDDAG